MTKKLMPGRRWWLTAAVTVAVAVPAAVAASESGDATAQFDPQGQQAQTTGPPDGLRSQFEVLRRAGNAADTVTAGDLHADPSADVDAGFARASGMNLAQAKRLTAARRLFAVPAQGTLCLVDGDRGSAACTPYEHVGRDLQTQVCGGLPTGTVTVVGLVDDGVRAARVHTDAGRIVRAGVGGNLLTATVSGAMPVAAELVRADGRTVRQALPALDADALNCG